MAGLAAVVLFYVVAIVADPASYAVVNAVGPLAMSVVLAVAILSLVRRDRNNLWTALLWFRLSTIVYFGIGTGLLAVIDQSSRSYLESFFRFSDEDVLRLNILVVLSVIVVLLFARLAVALSVRREATTVETVNVQGPDHATLLPVGIFFLAVGLAVNFTIKVPYDFGWITVEVPGAIMNLTKLLIVGIFLVTLWSLQRAPWWLPVVTVLLILHLAVQVLMFNKVGVLLPLLMFLLAFLWTKASLKRIVVCAAIVAGLFSGLQPLITEARHELDRRYGADPQAGFRERADIIQVTLARGSTPVVEAAGGTALTRLSQVNSATLVMHEYDLGRPADWPTLLPAVLVPRLLWTDKPIITDTGRDIYELGTGRRTSQAGAGIFADAYWAMGWWGLVVLMPIYGAILGFISVFGARVVREGRWLFLPVALLAVQIGYRADGHYLADIAGGTVMLVSTYVVFAVIQRGLVWLSVPAFSLHGQAEQAPTR